MVRDQIRRHLQGIAKLAVTLNSFHEEVHDQQPIGLCQNLETLSQFLQIDWRLFYYFHGAPRYNSILIELYFKIDSRQT
jgi:hypothetical protein